MFLGVLASGNTYRRLADFFSEDSTPVTGQHAVAIVDARR